MRSIVSTCDKLADDPQALSMYLGMLDLTLDMVAIYRNAIRDADARDRRPRRNPGQCRRITRRFHCTIMFTAHHAR
ncbi:hypothetical protein ACIRRH_24870 [Kitasatospora sp. NPDC101235]|uniref:hypothetical protein n=1 Tax=Kitasatospora sp. NPDC101235 TaxID=3364101 RepID=UPI0037F2643B